MAGTLAKRHPQVDVDLLNKVVARISSTGSRVSQACEELGDYLFTAIFNNSLEKAVGYKYNPYYRHLISMAKTGNLGEVSAEWLRKVVHVDTMTRVLRSMDRSGDYEILSYTHRSRFVGTGFSRASFVADTCKMAVKHEWSSAALQHYLSDHRLKTGETHMTPALAKRTLHNLVRGSDRSKEVRLAAKTTYRKMMNFLDDDEWDAQDKMTENAKKEFARYLKDYEAEKKAREKKRK